MANNVTVIDGATNTTTTIGVGQRPLPVAVNSLTNTIYVGNQSRNSVCIIDGNTGVVTTTVGVGTRPQAIAINSLTNQIYVANYQCASVSVIDGATNNVTPVTVGSYPAALAVDPVHNRVYVANSGDNTATLIDGASFATTTVTVGDWPIAVDVDSVTNKAYFATQQNYGSVTQVNGADLSTGDSRASAAIHRRSRSMPSPTAIYTANEQDNTASVVAGAATLTRCSLCRSRHAVWSIRVRRPDLSADRQLAAGRREALPCRRASCGVPATAAAYSLNVTVVPSGSLGYLTIWPTGESQPVVSTLNSPDGRMKANAAIVPAGAARSGQRLRQRHDQRDSRHQRLLSARERRRPCSSIPSRRAACSTPANQHGHLGGPYLHGTHERDFPVL